MNGVEAVKTKRMQRLARWQLSIVAWIVAPLAVAENLDEIFPAADSAGARPSAESIVAAAFSNLFDFDGIVRIESARTTPGGESQVESSYTVYRKRLAPRDSRVLVVSSDPEAPAQEMRMLEVASRARWLRGRLFVPRVASEPIATDYRLTDPFLGTFTSLPPNQVRADLSSLARAYEIIGRQRELLEGLDVDRITVRPLAARAVERVELFIAREAPLILEFRFFEGGDAAPARVTRAPRDAMVEYQGRRLPGVLIYDDRVEQTLTRLRIRYAPLPDALGDAPFQESTFHRVPLPE